VPNPKYFYKQNRYIVTIHVDDDILKRAARTIDLSQVMRHMFRTQLSHKFSDLSNLRAWAITIAKVNYAEAFTYTVS